MKDTVKHFKVGWTGLDFIQELDCKKVGITYTIMKPNGWGNKENLGKEKGKESYLLEGHEKNYLVLIWIKIVSLPHWQKLVHFFFFLENDFFKLENLYIASQVNSSWFKNV